MSTPVTALPAVVPEGTCPQSFQEILNLVSAYTSYFVPGTYNSYVISASTPSVSDQDKLWLKLDGDGNPERLYYFANGAWVSKHPTAPGLISLYMDDVSSLDTFDGGSVGAVTATTGPMWEVVSEAVGRTAVHPDPGGTVLSVNAPSVGDTFGEEKHLQTVDELVAHTHTGRSDPGTAIETITGSGGSTVASSTGSTGGGLPFNVCQPSIAIYYIRRTAREFFVG